MDRTQTFGGGQGQKPEASEPTLRVVFTRDQGVTASPAARGLRGCVLGRATTVPEFASFANDNAASRQHARIDVRDDGVTVTDLESRNGTFVNGQRIHEAFLHDGDALRVGSTLLVFRDEPQGAVDGDLPALRGRARAIRAARALLAAAAPTGATILLLGESGTGKTIAARAVHEASGREGAFVHVNCAAIPEALAESSLFGHVAGAFTDAKQNHPGFFRAAHKGTLFLDEIGELPAGVQAKLLTVIEDKRVIPLGGTAHVPADVRLVAATNANLDHAVQERIFRGDLYARISEFIVVLPALRERREDILPLFLAALPDASVKLDTLLAEALLIHPWPYNVREVQKTARALDILLRAQPADAMRIMTQRLAVARPQVAEASLSVPPPSRSAAMPTKDELIALLVETCGTISAVAERTGRSRKQVYRWLEQHEIDLDSFR